MSEKIPDSIISAEVRAAKIRTESAEVERRQAEAAAVQAEHAARRGEERRKTEDPDVEMLGSLYGATTRDELLEHVRRMREPSPPPPPPIGKAELAAEPIYARANDDQGGGRQ